MNEWMNESNRHVKEKKIEYKLRPWQLYLCLLPDLFLSFSYFPWSHFFFSSSLLCSRMMMMMMILHQYDYYYYLLPKKNKAKGHFDGLMVVVEKKDLQQQQKWYNISFIRLKQTLVALYMSHNFHLWCLSVSFSFIYFHFRSIFFLDLINFFFFGYLWPVCLLLLWHFLLFLFSWLSYRWYLCLLYCLSVSTYLSNFLSSPWYQKKIK